MAYQKAQSFKGRDYNNQELTDLQKVQINQDAQNADEAVRKSQAENIADQAAQDILVETSGNASTSTAFTSASMVSFLAAKQDNMSIESSSTGYLEIVNGTEIKVKQLLISTVTVDSTYTNLSDWIANNPSNTLGEGDVLILAAAVDNQQRSWINNGNNSGTVTEFTRLQTDYNEATIRAFFSGSTFLDYDPGAGVYALRLGTEANKLGAQTLPMDATKFQTIAASNTDQEKVNLALEQYIKSVDDNATGGVTTTNTRLDSLSGVTGNNLGAFTGGVFTDNSNIKNVLQESETKHVAADTDRAAIRSEVATADAAINSALQAETLRALSAEASETSARQVADIGIQTQVTANSSAISTEQSRATNAENALSGRLDVVEGSGAGSIAKAESDANAYTDTKVAAEASRAQAEEAAIRLEISNLAEGDITFVGQILVDGTLSIRQERINAGDTRNGQAFTAVNLLAGETFIFAVDTTITYTDSNAVSYLAGDKLMLVDDVASGALVESKVNAVPANATGLDITNIGSSTIELDGNDDLGVIANSIGRAQISGDVEADIDDKRSVTLSNEITSPSDTHFVTDVTTDAAQNIYYKRVSNTSDALTGTKRSVLGELFVASAGSGNPLAPSYAHTATLSTHYTGTSTDMSMAIGGVNCEANVTNPGAAVYATGVYALAQSNQLGINSAVTGVAQNAGLSNIGITGFGKAGGVGKDRGGVFALSDLDFLNYAATRSVSPISYPDVALIADAGTSATGLAFVAVGNAVFESGTVTVPSAVNDTDAVNLGDIKGKEADDELTIPAGGEVTFNHGKGTKKISVEIWNGDVLSTSDFVVERDGVNAIKIYNPTGSSVNIEVLVRAFS